MADAAIALLVLGLLVTAVAAAVLPLVLTGRAWVRVPAAALLYGLALVLLVVWVVASYQAGVHADETGTEGSPLGTSGWLALALASAVGSVLVTRASDRRTARPEPHG